MVWQSANTAEKCAADDRRSLTSLIEKLLVEHLKAKAICRNDLALENTL